MRSSLTKLLALACVPTIPVAAQSSVFSLEEKTAKGKAMLAYPPSAAQPVVDINSSLMVKLDKDALAAILHGSKQEQLTHRMKQLTELQAKANVAMERSLSFQQRVSLTASAQQGEESSKGWGPLQQDFVAAQKALSEVTRGLRAYLQESRPESWRGLDDDLALFESKRPAFLRDEVLALAKALKSKEATGARIEITARLGKGGFIHVPGYDSLPTGVPNPFHKTEFVFGAAYQAGVDGAEALAKSIQEGQGLQAGLRMMLNKRLAEAKVSAATFEEAISKVRTDLAKVGSSWKPAEKEFSAVLKAWADFQGALKDLSKDLPNDSTSPGDALVEIATRLQKLSAPFGNLKGAVSKLQERLVAMPPELSADLRTAWQDLGAVMALLDNAKAAGSTPIGELPQAILVPIEGAKDSEISLITTPRTDGESLEIKARLYKEGAPVSGPPTFEQIRLLEVRATGWVAEASGAVQFVRVIGDPRNSYVPAPSAYAVFRYRGKRASGDSDQGFFGFLAPGVGLATVSVPMQDGSSRLGFMGTAHLFGDLVQISYGRTTSNDRLFSVGIGLQKLFGYQKVF